MKQLIFPAKILLFGEYTIFKGGKALSIPYHKYSGHLEIPSIFTKKTKQSNALLKEFVKVLKSKNVDLNFKVVDHDIQSGMAFHSNIPVKYGLGSSGALVAAFYSKYFDTPINRLSNDSKIEIKKIQSQLAVLESCFHGYSSGLDPLVSLIAKPIIYQDQQIEILSEIQLTKENFFLLDSSLHSHTQPWVTKMMKRFKNSSFETQFKKQYLVASDLCIDSFLRRDSGELVKHIKTLSQTTLDLLDFLIPQSIVAFWHQGIQKDHYYLKLCGSGGGGFILGYTDDWNKLKALQKNFKMESIFTSECF
ncbi:MAG: mevalonate kinase [Flavobacteriaceae bacterium]|nr:mevalonate kinase [Flavobacteriaceae bacterium]MCY4268270.1 mevalonate kinase [Flavobacteriaceae bacterium]MCY4298496.1 mevalonate kinase [Flavobacteriaceae bacterium]